jgi:hypothetical protein
MISLGARPLPTAWSALFRPSQGEGIVPAILQRQSAARSTLALRIAATLLAAALSACGGGAGDASWLFPLWVPTDIAVRDIDGDGRADVLTLAQLATSMTHREGRLSVYRQQPGGSFAPADTYVVGIYPWHFAIADVDGDGAPDVVVADVDEDAVSWLRQDPVNAGHFLAPVALLAGLNPYDLATADFSGDGAADVAATDSLRSAQRIVMLAQNAGAPGSFGAASDVALPGSSVALAGGDLDADGFADLAVAYTSGTSASVFDTTLATMVQLPGSGLEPAQALVTRRGLNAYRLAAADYDGDGTQDLMAYLAQSSTDYTSELLAVVRPLAGAPAVIEASLAGVLGTDDAAFGDLDGDGRLDAALAGSFPVGSPSRVESRLNVFLQDAGGVLRAAPGVALPINVSRLAAGDVDGDGRLDLVLLGGDDQALLMLQSHANPGTFLAPTTLP